MTSAREPYDRFYWVVRASIPKARKAEIYAEAAKQNRTVGPSYDDAGIGEGLRSRTAVVWDIPMAARGGIRGWFKEYYPGTIVRFEGKGEDKPPPPPPTGTGWSPKMGLHAAASPDISAFHQFQILKPAFIKIMTNQNKDGIARLAREHDATFIIRAYARFYDDLKQEPRKVYPRIFHEWTAPDFDAIFQILERENRSFIVELHNEPNLVMEGHMLDGDNHPTDPGSWCAGHQFNQWAIEWRDAFQRTFGQSIQLITPGLSPGGYRPNVRADSAQFHREMKPAVSIFGGMGIHCYWSEEAPLHLAVAELQELRAQFPGVPKYITEFSHNKQASNVKKAQSMGQFIREIEKMPDVIGATAFVAADPHGMFPYENWSAQDMAPIFRDAMGY